MGLIIDTCIFIQAERDNHPVTFKRLESFENAYISAITVSELLVGVHHANTEARRLKRSAFVEAIINEIPTLDFTAEISRIHAELYFYLSHRGKLIGAHDLIIAATAISHGYALLTNNHEEFNRIPGLKLAKS